LNISGRCNNAGNVIMKDDINIERSDVYNITKSE